MPFETGVVGTGPHRKGKKEKHSIHRSDELHVEPDSSLLHRVLKRQRERGRREKPRRSAARADANGRLQVAPSWPDHEVFDLFAATSRNTEKVQEGNQAAGPAAAML